LDFHLNYVIRQTTPGGLRWWLCNEKLTIFLRTLIDSSIPDVGVEIRHLGLQSLATPLCCRLWESLLGNRDFIFYLYLLL